MQIKNKSISLSNTVSNRSFFEEISSLRPTLMTAGSPTSKVLELNDLKKYHGDFHGLLTSLGVPTALHQIVTVLNGYSNTTDFIGLKEEIFIPDLNAVQSLISTLV